MMSLRRKNASLIPSKQIADDRSSVLRYRGAVMARGSFTIEQVLSSPFPTELIASPAGNRVAWVFDARGLRNIWVADPGAGETYRSRQVTQYTQDDGQDVGELAWTPDGQSIVYVRGGDFENDGISQPGKRVRGVEQDVWVVSLEGGAPRKLAEGHSPAVSPKGGGVAYIFKDQVWLIKLAAGAKPEQLIHDKGKCDSCTGRRTARAWLLSAAGAITASWECITSRARA